MAEFSTSELVRMAQQMLESLDSAGVQQLPRPTASRESIFSLSRNKPEEVSHTGEEISSSQVLAKRENQQGIESQEETMPSVVSNAATLEVLREEVAGCTLCQELAETRTQTVFGVGNPQARLCLLGEAPGAEEDRQGEPFVGRSGQLLTKILEACHLSREDVYILNILKCRPPGNRNPTPAESQNCRRYLDRQLELINPEFICCLGAVAAQNLLETTEAIGRMRGRIHDYQGIKVVCTYHPAYLLRNPPAKKDAWEDMKFLMREMGTPVG
ncbi:uracil-DNA glycosylase [Bythopirellula goksoeyrii]|uniref:Type-4 uracil-DNA glycosylase n=1 Tax=Bythopirellula goksoeyrii TaxID=1400387 RepID=A0A5B9Q622_9BACT|nr:uracil-DNA glycosylase [Bythopirellula goksoeyrii]QEG34447.1 Uracil DNA glycosylase superfamily protein [Bythopirellula goksoeyrii]